MKKIPTLFRRDPDDMRQVLPEVTPGCEWVLAGEGVATRKYDGTCVMRDGQGDWWARREVKPGKAPPPDFYRIDHDEDTGKTVGWEPIENTGWTKYLDEAITAANPGLKHGTYELCGPKVNRNPEGFDGHRLIFHAEAEVVPVSKLALTLKFAHAPGETTAEYRLSSFRTLLTHLGEQGWEGIVWHHSDGRMAKLKARDFPR